MKESILELNSRVVQSYSLGKYQTVSDIQAFSLATEAYVKCQESQEKSLHLVCCSNLALMNKTLGNYEEAISLYSQVIEKYKAITGLNNKPAVTCLYNLALTYKVKGAPDKALPLLQEVLERRTSINDINSMDYFSTLVNISSCYKDLG